MVASFSFANEKTIEIVVENNVQTVSIETQQTETVFLSKEEMLKMRYCWTSSMSWLTGNTATGMDGEVLYEVITYTWTSCIEI